MAVAMIGPKFYAWDRNGKPLAFGKLYTYEARTNNPKPTYQSEDQVVENTNPVILNGEGYANVYLSGRYKMVLKDEKENEIWSSDPVSSSSAEEWVNCASAQYLSSTTFKLVGNFTDSYTEERKIRLDSNDTEYDYSKVVSSSYSAGETTITVADSVVKTGLVQACVSIVGFESSFNNGDLGGLTNYQADSVDDIISGRTVNGDIVKLELNQRWAADDYYGGSSPNNSGVLFFKVVPGGTGVADGGKYIDLPDGLQLEQNMKTAYVTLEQFGSYADGVTASDSARDNAIAYLPKEGGAIKLDVRKYLFTTPWISPPLITVFTEYKSQPNIPSSLKALLGITDTIGCELFFDGCDGVDASAGGFQHYEGFLISGTSGGYIGLNIIDGESLGFNPNVSTTNVSVRGFLDGIGVVMEDQFRTTHIGLNIQKCGLGMLWGSVVNTVSMSGLVIENCALGWLCNGGTSRANTIEGTIEGNAIGKAGVSFPSTDLVTVGQDILADYGITQDRVEGGMMAIGFGGTVHLYFEANSLCNMYLGNDSVVSVIGGYNNNKLAVGGTYALLPENCIKAPRARSVTVNGCYFSVDSNSGNALFDINTSRSNTFKGNRYIDSASTYTGEMYENTIGGTVNYSNASELEGADNYIIGDRSRVTAKPMISVSSSPVIELDATTSSIFNITALSDSATVSVIGTAADGQELELYVKQDATGGRTLTFDSNLRVSWDESIGLGNGPNNESSIIMRYRAVNDRWYQLGGQAPWHV